MSTEGKMKMHYIHKSAEFSDCGLYRYLLTRKWDESKPTAMCIGLNPSTANSDLDDQTIMWLTAILRHHGYGELLMTNLYAIISSKPDKIFSVSDPQRDNNSWLQDTARKASIIIYCWGNFERIEYRAKQVQKMLPDGHCLGKSSSGAPYHPLAVMYNGLKPELTTITPYTR
jgi:hypothetical protein